VQSSGGQFFDLLGLASDARENNMLIKRQDYVFPRVARSAASPSRPPPSERTGISSEGFFFFFSLETRDDGRLACASISPLEWKVRLLRTVRFSPAGTRDGAVYKDLRRDGRETSPIGQGAGVGTDRPLEQACHAVLSFGQT